MPLFSIVIPVHNRAGLISATLDSVLRQTFTDHEIILVDDASTDDLAPVLQRYQDRIQILRQDQCGGAGAARNRGIAAARGTYTAFLDSDDIWFPWTLQTFADTVRDDGSPAIVMGSYFLFADPAELGRVAQADPCQRRFPDFMASRYRGVLCGAGTGIFRTDLLRQVQGFVERQINAEDLDLVLRLGVSPGFIQIDAPFTLGYRRHAFASSAHVELSYAGLAEIYRRERSGAYPGGLPRRRDRLEIITFHLRSTIRRLVEVGHFRLAFDLYLKAFPWNLRLRRGYFLTGYFALVFLYLTGLWKRKTGP